MTLYFILEDNRPTLWFAVQQSYMRDASRVLSGLGLGLGLGLYTVPRA
jgi:hypothetical protein